MVERRRVPWWRFYDAALFPCGLSRVESASNTPRLPGGDVLDHERPPIVGVRFRREQAWSMIPSFAPNPP
jgi:hypothetical protein